MKHFGYKKGIHLGLTLYSLGAIFFWPSAVYRKYGGFVGCTFVIGCGLSCLEVAANSYIAVLGTPQYAAMRLNFSQAFQGLASFAGPLIASHYFFRGANATSLDTVQWCVLIQHLIFGNANYVLQGVPRCCRFRPRSQHSLLVCTSDLMPDLP